ncbi:non-ribosomal peptide synthetase [Dyella subtropica]|uniref:non-ribosomal peptide synthetase n=1 Tax=Dyella subtropica TaxID=2992127 RepID=UPI0022591B2A|nr:non-ribosomal peptide synthetase [Dyella subtropica]
MTTSHDDINDVASNATSDMGRCLTDGNLELLGHNDHRPSSSGAVLERQSAYWRQTLHDAPVLLELPLDRPRPAQQSFAGDVVAIELDAAQTRALKALSQRHGVTLYMTVLAAWAAVLARLSGQQDVVIGTPVANRTHPEVDGLIGFYNTQALRLNVAGTVAELLDQVKGRVLDAQTHQDLPFEQLLDLIKPPRSLAHTPIFQVMLSWRSIDENRLDLHGAVVSPADVPYDVAKFDLELDLGESNDRVMGGLRYATALFDRATIERQVGYLHRVLAAMVADERQALERIDMLAEAERRQLLVEWNDTATNHSDERCIHELFEAQAARAPEAIAVIYEQQQLSYGELNRQANRLAHYLRGLGVTPNEPVAICMERSPEMAVGMLAVLKAGGGYVPLDPAYPLERLDYMLQDVAPKVLLTQARLKDHLPQTDATVIAMDSDEHDFARHSDAALNPAALGLKPEHLAYVIYTSGSTGKPKGVMVEHRQLVNLVRALETSFALTPADRVLQFASPSFDVSVEECFGALCAGSTLVMRTDSWITDAAAFWRHCVDGGITALNLPTAFWYQLVNNRNTPVPGAVRQIVIGGEKVSPELVARWFLRDERLPRLINAYGPTETTVDVSLCLVDDARVDDARTAAHLIGRPIANTQIYILDAHGQPAPIGVAGELYIGGKSVARGYLNRPEQTAERFLVDPFSSAPDARMYRTGDIGRWLPGGVIEYLERNDHQVKIRGFRVELGEIEARLAEHPAVLTCAVLAREDVPGDKRLVAYVVADAQDQLIVALREHLAQCLPDYMVPAAFVTLHELPLTPNGKLDRKALPAPAGDAYARRAYAQPQGESEQVLAALWEELLGIGQIGRHDNFFELGGHSLLAVQLLERLRRRGLPAPVHSLFATPTLMEVAAAMDQGQREIVVPPNRIMLDNIRPDSAAITPDMLPLIELTQADIDRIVAQVPEGIAHIQDIYALSPLQEGILFHHALATEGDPYVVIGHMSFADRDVLDRYLAAMQHVVDRHDVLRTAFAWEGLSTPAQIVWRHASVQAMEFQLDPADGPVRAQLVQRFDASHYRMPLAQAPLLRLAFAHDPNSGRWVLLEVMHHLIGDHAALELMHAEVYALMEGRGHLLQPPQPFRHMIAQMRQGRSEQEHERYFRAMLADIDEPTAPFGVAAARLDGTQIREAHRPLPQALNDRLRAQARRLGVSLASLCHLAWGQVVARTSGRESVVFGTVLFGRMSAGEGADRALGLFINTLPLRLDLDDSDVLASVQRTHARLAELLKHEHASLALAQRCSGVAAPHPLFTTVLNYRHNDAASQPTSLGIEWLGEEERSNYPFAMSVEDGGHNLGLTAQSVPLVAPERLCAYMQRALEQLTELLEHAPRTPVRRIDIVPADERRYLLDDWNQTEAPYPSELCLHQLFERHAHETPDAVAVVHDGQSLTYAELNARANQLAHHLIELGVKPEDRVALCAERSFATMIGLLGILKAGGVYVPLDPAYASARLTLILGDVAPVVVLVDAAGRAALGSAPSPPSLFQFGGEGRGEGTLLSERLFASEEQKQRPIFIELDASVAPHPNPLPEGEREQKHGLPQTEIRMGERELADLNPAALGLTSRHLAYIIYTSGSTGTPKGVMLEHRNAVHLAHTFRPAPASRVLQFASLGFDASTLEIVMALTSGGSLYLPTPQDRQSAPALMTYLERHAITHAVLPPAFLQGHAELLRLTRQPTIIFGGETPSLTLMQALSPQATVINGYGPTEGTVCVSTWTCPIGTDVPDIIPIGRPIPNTRLYVLDGHGQPVPQGAIGELYIGGAGVARGYLHRPEQTAERFLDDPFSPHPGARMYRTGDLVRHLPDGNLMFLGRNDHQVKIRGFRIELGEIEAKLAEHPAVRECVVLARADHAGDKRLVAYVATASAVDATHLRSHLQALLPDYMVPAAFVQLDALPLTAHGKVDHRVLPVPDSDAFARQVYEAPQGAIEQTLAALWQDLLGVQRVGRHDHFFELGGHSLTAVRLLGRITQALGVELPLATLFAQPVLHRLAASLAEQQLCGSIAELPAIPLLGRDDALPLSFAQQRLWFLAQIEGGSEAYHIPLTLRLSGRLDRVALKRALNRIVERHEALRTTFVRNENQTVQRIAPADVGFALEERDLSGTPTTLERHLHEVMQRPFDLTQGPLIRGELLRLGDEEHVLAISMHHIVSDAWSIGVLTEELSALYRAYGAHANDPLPALPVQYADYAAWQRQWLNGAVLERQGAYWQQTLQSAPALLELPLDRPRPAQQSYAGDMVAIELDAALTRALKALSQRHGVTLYMTVLAAWAAVLARLSGQQDVVIGTPVANRTHPQVDELIGFFVNTQALRLDVAGTVAELLNQVKGRVLDAQTHQDLPFEQVVDLVKPPRNLAHTPIFQVMLAWRSIDENRLSLPGLEVSPLEIVYDVAKFDLELDLGETGDRVTGGLRYATALFDRATVERQVAYLHRMLAAMVADERQALERIDMLAEAERRQLLVEWNVPERSSNAADHSGERCIHELFEAQAVRTPEAIAVVYEQQQLSYGELNRQANRLAHHLRGLGVKPDDRVAICVARSLEMLVAILAVLKAGGAYVPLDPTSPADRLQHMLTDSDPVVVLTTAGARSALAALTLSAPLIDLQADAGAWSHHSEENPTASTVGLAAHHLAYIIYTSGSTGLPKGVMVEHANVVRLFTATQHWYQFDANDVWTLFHSFAFDFSVWEIWGALLHGGRLVVVPHEISRSPEDFYRLLCEQQVTVLNQTPSAFNQLIAAQGLSQQVHSLRYVIFGGEALELRNLAPWYARNAADQPQLINMYGITETTVHVTYRPLLPEDLERHQGRSPVGQRIPDLRLYILDAQHQPAPIGVTGELYVGGAGVARGYLNRPELNAERFIANPFVAGERLYKTGDLGRFRADGDIDYLGRNDTQVKIRGFRIELGEIEARLAEYPNIREAVVLAREDQPGDKRLVAYLITDEGAPLVDLEALRQHLGASLPEYMVPAAYVTLAAFPLTANGKLDRKALPVPDGGSYLARAYEAPIGDVEETLARIWTDVLKLERVGRHDNFFELGGHSLLALTLIERMRQANLPVDVRVLFTTPTLMGIAAALDGESNSKQVSVPPNLIAPDAERITPDMLPLIQLCQDEIDRVIAQVPGGARNVQDIYPLAPLQEGFLFHSLLEEQGDIYLTAILRGADSRDQVERYSNALQTVIDRHDILRTAMAWEGLPEPVQVVWRNAPLQVEEIALDPAHGDIAKQLLDRFDARHYRFDLRQAPLWRLFIAEDVPNRRWVVLELIHHVIDDHTTMEFLTAEVRMIMQGKADALPVPVPFRNFIAQTRLGMSREEHEAFFRDMLGDVTEPTAPFGLMNVRGDANTIVAAQHRVDAELCRRLRAGARSLGVSMATLGHLAFAMMLARVSGRDDVVFGTVMSGRMQGGEGADRAMGVFINTLPVRIHAGKDSVRDSARKTHERLTGVMRHEQAPLVLAQRCSAVPSPAPLFSALLNYRHDGDEEFGPARDSEATNGLEILSGQEFSNYPFGVSINDHSSGLSFDAYADGSIDPQRICAMLDTALTSLMNALETAPATPVCRLEILPFAERQQVLAEWNDTAVDFTREPCIHELFEALAERTPDAIAVVYEQQQLSYGELNRRANRLAHDLNELGVKPDDRVAICMERGAGFVIALLGVLKAGGGYVPLDPAYPRERLAYMLGDAAPSVVVADAVGREALAPSPLRGEGWGEGSTSRAGLFVAEAQERNTPIIIELDASPAPHPTPFSWEKGKDENGLPGGERELNVAVPGLTPDHLAYVIYTSGSTGAPKGVMVEHRQLVSSTLARHTYYGATERFLLLSSMAFDSSVAGVFGSLTSGGCLHIPDRASAQDPQIVSRIVLEQDITRLLCIPSFAQLVLLYLANEARGSLRDVLLGGEPCPPALAQAAAAFEPAIALYNEYGPTEGTVWATVHLCSDDEVHPVPIGRPIANARIYLLDTYGNPVPQGAMGEIHIGGATVARGYLNRPELTAERFLDDPFDPVASARMYRTGDLARHLPDGNLVFLGRNDAQIKIRGFRIEVGEIEARLAEHSAVRECAVLARTDARGDKRLIAYVMAEPRDDLAATLRTHLTAQLPDYMVPAAFVTLEALPLTTHGKLDQRALPEPDSDAFARQAFEAPQGVIEQTLATLWQDLLGVESVSRHDHFFELGGHSLIAVRLLSRIAQTFDIELPLGIVFAQPTLSTLAAAVATQRASSSEFSAPALVPITRDGMLPLSFAQQRLWFLAQLDGVSEAYHIPQALRLRGELNVAALRSSLDRLFARHEGLRTIFVAGNGEPHVELLPAASGLALAEHDLRDVADASVRLAQIASEVSHARFDLARGPLIRACLARLGEQEHVLLLTLHHIVSDGWSMGVLTNELSTLYAAALDGHADPLLPLAVQYPDYAAWQRQWLAGERLQAQASYWRQALADVPTLLALPTDRPRPPQQSFEGSWLPVQLDPALTDGLKRLSQRHGTTLFMTVMAAWAVVLSRLSGQDDLVIGTPSANRGRREIEPLIGFFVNTLALRIDLSGQTTASELLSRVRRNALAAQDHQDLPFEQVVDIAHPSRSLDHTPLFQVLFAWQSNDEGRFELPGLVVEPVEMPLDTIHFDLELHLQEKDDGIDGVLAYATALFDADTMARQRGYLIAMLEGMVADAAQPVATIDLLASDERGLLLDGWNHTEAAYSSELCIHQLFERQVQATPDAVALVFDDQSLSYAELNAQANRLAHQLIASGAQPNDRIAICVDRSFAMVVGLLAILKAGAAYVPLDPAYPRERLAQILDGASPTIVLVDAVGREALGLPESHLVNASAEGRATGATALDLDRFAGADLPQTNPNLSGLTPSHLAYVIFTSGSTGTPKGVAMPHRPLVNLIDWQIRQAAPQRTLQFAALGFDVAFQEIFSTLCAGSTLVLIHAQTRLQFGKLIQLLGAQQVQRLFLPYIAAQSLAEALDDVSETDLTGLRQTLREVIVAGEQLRITPQLKRFFQKLPACRLHNHYGPTESHVVTSYVLGDDIDHWPTHAPIGRPIANARIYLLDAQRQPVPMGTAGELYIGGVGVAHGYLHRPELSAERFLSDPFHPAPDARMYRTGDLARYLPDGNLVFLERNDHQVKIRGFRIELGEIEAQLAEHPAVRECAVLAREDSPGDKRLVAYVVAQAHEELSNDLRAHLAARLPDYMVPAAFVLLDALPLTPNGKLDRNALPVPEGDAFVRQSYEAPQGEVEQALATLWQDLLGVERVGRHDHFFELGGHSLIAVRLLSRIGQTFNVELPLATLFAQPVLSRLAEALIEYRRPGSDASRQAIPVIARDGVLALSFAQQRLWFLAQLDGVSATYHLPMALRLHGALDVAALRRSLDQLFARHEGLRTVFVTVNGKPQVELLPADQGVPWIEHDVCGSIDAPAELARIVEEEANTTFDLAAGPLIRARLIRVGEQEHVFLLTQHHIVSDGWSIGVLTNELSTLYAAVLDGHADPLPPLDIQYPDYAAWQRQWLAGERLHAQADYWRRTLGDAPTLLALPTDRPRPPQQRFEGNFLPVTLNAELAQGLKRLSQQHGTTLFMTLMSAWAIVLARLSGQDDLVIGTPIAGRGRQEIEPLIGFFVNTLALRIDMSGAPKVRDLLARVRQLALDAQAHADLPFEQVVDLVQPPRRMDHTPLFQVLFAWQNNDEGVFALPGLRVEAEPETFGWVKFDLELAFGEADGTIQGGFNYATALFDQATIERHRDYLIAVLKAMVADAQKPVAQMDLLSSDERRFLLDDWNQTEAPYPSELCLHQLFERHVHDAPDAIAVVHDGQSLTYAELNARANQLAHHLIGLGVKPEDRVALCAERSLATMAGLLSILKAGGAYVPLDPAYASARLTQILGDAAPAIVLVDAAGRAALGSAPSPPSLFQFGGEGRGEGTLLSERLFASEEPKQRPIFIELDASVAPHPNPLPGGEREQANLDPDVIGLTPNHLAYIIYTSGSTGTPKGVMVEHRNAVHLAYAFRPAPASRVLQFASLGFDASVLEIVTALTSGGSLYLPTPEDRQTAPALMAYLERHAITHAVLPPAFLQGHAELPRLTRQPTIIFGGETPSPALIRALSTQATVINAYGPTEGTVCVSTWTSAAHTTDLTTVPMGRPIANTRLYVLDGHGHPVPRGAIGELYIGGASVARGYLHRPEQTAERFLDDPFNPHPGARMYRTGDLVRHLPDGNLVFLGRNDGQVKIRGFRIELGEIEAKLAEHPAVHECTVLVRADASGDKRLIAYVVAESRDDLAATLRTHLTARLPDYMVPAAFVTLEALPLTVHGKVDQRALPEPDDDAFARQAYEAPQGAIEQTLATLWQELLGVERVGRHDHFFELGGHSLIAVQLVSRLRNAFGVEVAARDIFMYSVLKDMAQLVSPNRESARKMLDLDAELRLDPTIQATPTFESSTLLRHAFLTGASGFLGVFLLYSLLKKTQATVHCLIRCSSVEQGRRRLEENLRLFGLFDDYDSSRVVIVPGDLTKPLFGLAPSLFAELGNTLDAIYHNGAWVNSLHTYETLKAANVLGTQEVLRLASVGKLKHVHHVSTLSVIPSVHAIKKMVTTEEQLFERWEGLSSGYAQSKWVAEKILHIGASRGIPFTIYRPTHITGSTQNGASNPTDTWSLFIDACLELGCAPEIDFSINSLPVDYMSDCIVDLSLRKDVVNQSLNLANPHAFMMSDLINCMLEMDGVPMKKVAYQTWLAQCVANPSTRNIASIMPATIDTDVDTTASAPPAGYSEVKLGNAVEQLASEGSSYPSITKDFLQSYLGWRHKHRAAGNR